MATLTFLQAITYIALGIAIRHFGPKLIAELVFQWKRWHDTTYKG